MSKRTCGLQITGTIPDVTDGKCDAGAQTQLMLPHLSGLLGGGDKAPTFNNNKKTAGCPDHVAPQTCRFHVCVHIAVFLWLL